MAVVTGRTLDWTFGLRGADGRYLTQEMFGFAINANGPRLKKKQIFTLEQAGDGNVYIKTHLGRYLYGLADGKFLGDAEERTPDCALQIDPQPDGTWAIKTSHGYYLNGTGENLSAFVKDLPANGTGNWVVHLAMHPQINLMNVMRKRYVHLEDGELHCNEDIPWGQDALLTFVFFDDGRYGFIACNGMYLNTTGRLQSVPDDDCKFQLGFHDHQLSFRDQHGRYLSAMGGKGILKGNKQKIGKDQLFTLQDSEPQFVFKNDKGKYVSVRQSQQVKADQATETDAERFQLEFNTSSKLWSVKNFKELYWGETGGQIHARDNGREAKHWFEVEWLGNRVRFRAANGRYIMCKATGQLSASSDGSDDSAYFTPAIINRPQLVLRGPFGFVATKGGSLIQECNKSNPEVLSLVPLDGAYGIQGANGMFWKINADNKVTADGDEPELFTLEFVAYTHFLIRAVNGSYLKGEQNGSFTATGTSASANTLWEY